MCINVSRSIFTVHPSSTILYLKISSKLNKWITTFYCIIVCKISITMFTAIKYYTQLPLFIMITFMLLNVDYNMVFLTVITVKRYGVKLYIVLTCVQFLPWMKYTLDHITIKTPNPKCRLYWCLIKFIDWRIQSVMLTFRHPLWTSAPQTFSLVAPPPPFPV